MEHITGYIGKTIGDGMGVDKHGSTSRRHLTDWHGKVIGTCFYSSTWATPGSWASSTMHQVYAVVDGITYTGRSAGQNMLFKGKKTVNQS